MSSNTIDNDRTMSESEGTLLANRYRIVRQLGQGGMVRKDGTPFMLDFGISREMHETMTRE